MRFEFIADLVPDELPPVPPKPSKSALIFTFIGSVSCFFKVLNLVSIAFNSLIADLESILISISLNLFFKSFVNILLLDKNVLNKRA